MKTLTNDELSKAKGKGYFEFVLESIPKSLQEHCKCLKVSTSPYVAWRYNIKSICFEAYYLEVKVAVKTLNKYGVTKYTIKHRPL